MENCPHRGASLYFGRNEENGLRCAYHGWKYDVEGNLTDMPSEPEDSKFKCRIKQKSYPLVERGGVLWAYMGPAEHMPELPELEWALLGDVTFLHDSNGLVSGPDEERPYFLDGIERVRTREHVAVGDHRDVLQRERPGEQVRHFGSFGSIT